MKLSHMKLVGILALLFGGFAFAQSLPTGGQKLNTLVGPLQLPVINTGPFNTYLPVNGGTFTCATSAATVTNTNVSAGSAIVITLKTVGGTVAQPFIATITAGTGFTLTCGASDTSTYNFAIIG